MPKSKGEGKNSSGSGLDRRAVIRGALVVGGIAALAKSAGALPQAAPGSPEAIVAEREWARALARHVANQLPEAARQLPDLCLTPDQLQQLRKAFENTLIVNMGCVSPSGE